jgi:hypothetical protein
MYVYTKRPECQPSNRKCAIITQLLNLSMKEEFKRVQDALEVPRQTRNEKKKSAVGSTTVAQTAPAAPATRATACRIVYPDAVRSRLSFPRRFSFYRPGSSSGSNYVLARNERVTYLFASFGYFVFTLSLFKCIVFISLFFTNRWTLRSTINIFFPIFPPVK